MVGGVGTRVDVMEAARHEISCNSCNSCNSGNSGEGGASAVTCVTCDVTVSSVSTLLDGGGATGDGILQEIGEVARS